MPKKTQPVPRRVRAATSMLDMINRPASVYPEKPCFCYRRGGEDCAVTYSGLKELMDSVAAGIIGLSLAGAHIAVIGEKSPEWVAAFMGIIASRGVAVPLDKDLSHDQIPGFLEFADCKAVFYTDKYADIIESDDTRLCGIEKLVKIDFDMPCEDILASEAADDASGKSVSFASLARFGAGRLKTGFVLPDAGRDLDRLALIVFTSGTTGTSKGVMLTQRNIIFVCNGSIKYVDIKESDVLLSVLPLHHTYEMTAGLLSPLYCGCTICINESLTSLLSDFRRYRPTLLALVPLVVANMYKRIRGRIEKQGKEKTFAAAKLLGDGLNKIGLDVRRKLFAEILDAFGGRLENIVCGGAALDPELVKNFESFGIRVRQGYGITECAPVIGILPYDIDNPASCGRLLDGMQIYIDRENASDESGEICVKGPNVMQGYYKNPQATAEVLNSRGWFCTGDCGYVDENRYIYITGRKKNVIVLENGKNVFPEEIEEYLDKLPLVADCMVTAREDDVGKLMLTAILYPDYELAKEKGLLTEDDLKDFYKVEVAKTNKKLATFRQIKSIEIRKAPFPKTGTQKIQRHKVKRGE